MYMLFIPKLCVNSPFIACRAYQRITHPLILLYSSSLLSSFSHPQLPVSHTHSLTQVLPLVEEFSQNAECTVSYYPKKERGGSSV